MDSGTLARFMAKVDVGDECWSWRAAKNPKGYGVFRLTKERKNILAHRASYQHFVGPIPEGLTIDHLCENPACIRPEHLEAVSNAENQRRARVTHCPRGHPYPEEVVARPTGAPMPGCSECIRQHARRYRRERRMARRDKTPSAH